MSAAKVKRRRKPRWRVDRMDDAGQVFYSAYAFSEAIADQMAADWAEGGYTSAIYRRRYSVYLHCRTVAADDIDG